MTFQTAKPSREALAHIRVAAVKAATSAAPGQKWSEPLILLKLVVRCAHSQKPLAEQNPHPLVDPDFESINCLIPVVDGNAEFTDMADICDWSKIREGFPLTSTGLARIDICVYERAEYQYGGLLNNVVAHFTGNILTKVTETSSDGRVLYQNEAVSPIEAIVGF